MRTEFIARRRNFGVPGNEGANWKKGVPFGLVAVIIANGQIPTGDKND
jgi:hypothetical protein